MLEMYKGIPFSPQVALADSIGAGDTVIKVTDISAFPNAPSYATIGTDEEGETILYAAKTTDSLSGCVRGVEGIAKAWPVGTTIARNFTNKDLEVLQENIRDVNNTANSATTAAENAQSTANDAKSVASSATTAAENAQSTANDAKSVANNLLINAQAYTNSQVKKAAPRNLLDNSDFTNPVNQRGQKNYSGNVYTIDRWRIGNSFSACTIGSDYVLYTASGGTSYPRQIIKPTALMGGKTLTAAVCTRGGLIAVTSGVLPAETVSTTTIFAPAVTISEGVTLLLRKATDGTIDFMFQVNDGKSLTLRWAALYEGEYTRDNLPEYQAKGFGAELAECRCYYYRILGNNKWIATGAAVNTNEVRISIKLPTAMRIFPTVTIADAEQIRIKAAADSSASPSAISWSSGNEACYDIMIMNATLSGANGGDVCTLYLVNNGLIEFSADL